MNKKIMALIAAITMALAPIAGCSRDGKDKKSSSGSESITEPDDSFSEADESGAEVSDAPTEAPATEHVSPTETVTSTLGVQVTPNTTIQREDGSNTCKLPLSDFIQDGDVVESFTFIIYSDGGNIGTFKGGCGISVKDGCAAATDDGWYQSADFSASTQGTYGEIKWDVPAEIRDYISAGGDVMFGYWWGNTTSIRLDTAVCTFTRTAQIPCDGTVDYNIGKTVSYDGENNKIGFNVSDVVPARNIPQAVTFNISSGGALGKFTGAFSAGSFQSQDIAVFTDGPGLSLTWILPDEAKKSGTIELGYWWSEQNSITLDSVSVKYSYSNSTGAQPPVQNEVTTYDTFPTSADEPVQNNNATFRSSKEIVSAMNVGWNLGNTLDCYDYKSWTDDAETAWGNPKTTKDMIKSVKEKGFNSIRIPVTWGEHMNGDTIDSAWMNRVKEVVDYAYDEGMFVILNMHHDDYTWFVPNESQYSANSKKLCAIWTQISATFKDYGDRLLFEGMNEPRTVGSSAEWMGGTAAERAVINKYEQDFVSTVRASGGNNAERTLVVTTYAASAEDSAISDIVVPNDKNIIVSVHYYAPWKFSDGQTTTFGNAEKAELDAKFSQLKNKFIDKGIPLIIGEFGCVSTIPDNIRAQYYEYYIKSAKACGIKCFIWDDGIPEADKTFGIFRRSALSWNETILNSIMNGAK